jgi:hypothetical protein
LGILKTLELKKGNPLSQDLSYFLSSYAGHSLWSFAIVDIDPEFQVLFPGKSVFYNYLVFRVRPVAETPVFGKLEGGEL